MASMSAFLKELCFKTKSSRIRRLRNIPNFRPSHNDLCVHAKSCIDYITKLAQKKKGKINTCIHERERNILEIESVVQLTSSELIFSPPKSAMNATWDFYSEIVLEWIITEWLHKKRGHANIRAYQMLVQSSVCS